MSFQRLFYVLLAILAVYLGLYTWNLRTGVLDELATSLGLEFAGYVLRPYDRASAALDENWREYVDLRAVRRENAELKKRAETAEAEAAELRERAAEVERLERLLLINPPQGWLKVGARIIGRRMGPASALETVIIDKGSGDGLTLNAPALAPGGLVGRVIKLGQRTSLVLLATDLNHSLSAMGQESRVEGVLIGGGLSADMSVEYVAVSSPMRPGEILATSGLDGVFPKGIPVARVSQVGAGGALFQEIRAAPLVDPQRLEELVILKPADLAQAEDAATLREDSGAKPASAGRPAATHKQRIRAESAQKPPDGLLPLPATSPSPPPPPASAPGAPPGQPGQNGQPGQGAR